MYSVMFRKIVEQQRQQLNPLYAQEMAKEQDDVTALTDTLRPYIIIAKLRHAGVVPFHEVSAEVLEKATKQLKNAHGHVWLRVVPGGVSWAIVV